MKTLILLALLVATTVAVEPPIAISLTEGLRIAHCHRGDEAIIIVEPTPVRVGGSFRTTNEWLTLKDLSMVDSGLNWFSIRSVCSGLTGGVARVQVRIKREPPPPIITRHRTITVTDFPPTPGGLVTMLPAGTNSEYSTRRQKR